MLVCVMTHDSEQHCNVRCSHCWRHASGSLFVRSVGLCWLCAMRVGMHLFVVSAHGVPLHATHSAAGTAVQQCADHWLGKGFVYRHVQLEGNHHFTAPGFFNACQGWGLCFNKRSQPPSKGFGSSTTVHLDCIQLYSFVLQSVHSLVYFQHLYNSPTSW